MEPLFSPSWYRVAELRPRVNPEARFHRHEYRGEIWHLARGPATGRVHRLTPEAYALVGLMDGRRTADQIWNRGVERFGDAAPTQDETLRLLGVLHGADLVRCDVPPDTDALFRQTRKAEARKHRGQLNPISFRVPLCDPDAFLGRWESWVRPLFSLPGAFVWCCVVLFAGIVALRFAPELAASAQMLYEPAGLLALWFSYPLVKALHELGHAFAVKRWGGEVHELGIMFLIFMPVPYVDASASSVFPEKSRRMMVGGAGIAVELFLAAIATLIWVSVEPGLVRQCAYAVMLVGGVSTLFFNGNPLLRFDGYYVLADAIEIPDLAAKAAQYVSARARSWILGQRTELPETTRGETAWLVGYHLASYIYRLGVMFGIALYLAGHFFVAGVALALGLLFMRVILPLAKAASYVLTDPGVGERRGRALAGSLGLMAAVVVLVFGIPLPLRTQTQGVIWLPEKSEVRAGAPGLVIEVLAEPLAWVQPGEPLVRTRNAVIEKQLRVERARRDELRMRVHAASQENLVEAEILRDRLADADAALQRAHEEASEVVIRSRTRGRFVLDAGNDLVGRYVEKGDIVAYVVDLASPIARVVVAERDAARLREGPVGVSVRLAHDLGTPLAARLSREVPAGTDRLPTRALGTSGGGSFAVDPADPEGLQTIEQIFQFDLELPDDTAAPGIGQRVYVRFDHGSEPLGGRGYRALRRLLLRHFGV